jgi:hypothetical protein
MALNITEASAVNRLYHWLTGAVPLSGTISDEDAHEAMTTLVRSANRALSAGVSETQALAERARWPALAAHRD